MSDEIEELLRSADRPRELHDDELSRLRANLAGQKQSGLDVVELTASDIAAAGRSGSDAVARRRRRARTVLAALAVAAAVAVIFGVTTVGDDDKVQTGDTPEVPLSSVEEVCVGPVSDLASGLESWQSVANWSLTTRGEPDLALFARVALEALAGDAVTAARGQIALGDLDRALGELESALPGSAQAIELREMAVTNAISEIVSIIDAAEPNSPRCRFPVLDAAGS